MGSLSSITEVKSQKIYFVLGGMGAWGFVYAPFYAEILVKKILNEPMVISNNEKIRKIKRLNVIGSFCR